MNEGTKDNTKTSETAEEMNESREKKDNKEKKDGQNVEEVYESTDKINTDFYLIQKTIAKFRLDLIGLTSLIVTVIGIINKMILDDKTVSINANLALLVILLLLVLISIYTVVHTARDFYDLRIKGVSTHKFTFALKGSTIVLQILALVSLFAITYFNYKNANEEFWAIYSAFVYDTMLISGIVAIVPLIRMWVFATLMKKDKERIK